MQVAEIPILGALRETLLKNQHSKEFLSPFTVQRIEYLGKAYRPTPCLIQGAERRVSIATEPNAKKDRPQGIYGNRFAVASIKTIETACIKIDPPTIVNIIAMEAPRENYGYYDATQMMDIFLTAHTSFLAAKLESIEMAKKMGDKQPTVIIHTGHWGCGAYGGNKELMCILQEIAAIVADIDTLVYHTFDKPGLNYVTEGHKSLQELLSSSPNQTITQIFAVLENSKRYRWGVSDGN